MTMFPALADRAGTVQARHGTGQSGYVTEGGWHGTSPGNTVLIPSVCALAQDEGGLRGFAETSGRNVTYSGGDGTYWLAGRCTVTSVPSGWIGVSGAHYCWRQSTARPTIPSGLVLLGKATVAGGAITGFSDCAVRRITDLVTVSAARTMDQSAVWIVEPGGMLRFGSGVVFPFQGSIEAGRYQIFDVSAGGTITFPRGGTVNGEWWGAVGDDSTDSAPALTAAFASAPTNGIITLGAGIFRVGSTIVAADATTPGGSVGWELHGYSSGGGSGSGIAVTVLRRAAGFTGVLMRVQSPTAVYFSIGWTIQDIQFDGIDRPEGCHGLVVYAGAEFLLRNVRFSYCDRGLDMQAAQIATIEHLGGNDNNYGVIVSNEIGASTAITFFKGRIRNSWVNDVTIDGQHTVYLVRNIAFYGTVMESQGVTTGTNAGIHIRKAEQLHFHQCWIEGHSVHVTIESFADIQHPSRFITFYGCNFGQVSDESVNNRAFNFLGEGGQDGMGCWLESCSMLDGIFDFTQRIPVRLRGCGLLGNASIAGMGYTFESASIGFPMVIERLPTLQQWGLQRYHKEAATHTINLDERWITTTTTDAIQHTVTLFDNEAACPVGGALFLDTEVIAKQADNEDHAAWRIAGLFKNVTGTVVQVPTDSPADTEEVYAAINALAGRSVIYVVDEVDGVHVNIKWNVALTVRWSIRIRTQQFLPEV